MKLLINMRKKLTLCKLKFNKKTTMLKKLNLNLQNKQIFIKEIFNSKFGKLMLKFKMRKRKNKCL